MKIRAKKASQLITITLAMGVVLGCSDEPEQTTGRGAWGARELPVVTARVERAPLIDSIKSVGTARARQSLTLYTESA
ncbi:MAG TPA: hypothetical protein DHV35_03550, partial [Halieaceae bacterium]|nr:hypothetical protein [Halieaceae bacterium]